MHICEEKVAFSGESAVKIDCFGPREVNLFVHARLYAAWSTEEAFKNGLCVFVVKVGPVHNCGYYCTF